MPVNASNLKIYPLLTPKVHPRVCYVIWITLQLHRTVTENARIITIDTIDTINTINMIDIIDCINQYEENRYDQSDQLTLQNSPTQWNHCCFLFLSPWLIKVRSIVVLQYSVILLLRSPFIHILLILYNQSYSGTNSRCETYPQKRNRLLLCISQSDVSSWVYPTNITIFLCYRRYKLQQGGSNNNVKCHSRWWSENQWSSPLDLGVWQCW